LLPLRDLDVLVLAAQGRREVALTRVVHHRHDRREVRSVPRQLQRGRDVAAGRDAAEDAFFRGEPPRHRQALGGRRGDDPGQESDVEVLGNEAVADALDAVRPPLASRQQGALLGLDRVEPHARVLLAQEAADAGERAAAALRGDKGADDSAGLLPDLGPGRPVVRLDVVGVVELAGYPVAGAVTRADLLQTLEREVHVALAAGREDEVGPVGAHDLLALVAHARGHDDRAAVAFDGSHKLAGYPGIAGRALEHAHGAAQIARGLGAGHAVQVITGVEPA